MAIDTKWAWTILMRDGNLWHWPESIEIYELLQRFTEMGFNHTEIEAIIRH